MKAPYSKMILKRKSMYFIFVFICNFSICFVACENRKLSEAISDSTEREREISFQPSMQKEEFSNPTMYKYFESLGLVDVRLVDSTIQVDLKYATPDNFTAKTLYQDFDKAYLQVDAANMLAAAQQQLKMIDPEMSLLVYDAARPLSVQKVLWEMVKDTKLHMYVANPDKTCLHTYGVAVDITICDKHLIPLDMGSEFDYFGKLASVTAEQELFEQGKLTKAQVKNRTLLRKVMQNAGFKPISGEWWHFNACGAWQAKEHYTLIE